MSQRPTLTERNVLKKLSDFNFGLLFKVTGVLLQRKAYQTKDKFVRCLQPTPINQRSLNGPSASHTIFFSFSDGKEPIDLIYF